MQKKWRVYASLIIIVVISAFVAYSSSKPSLQGATSITFCAALIGVVVQLLRDDIANQRDIDKTNFANERVDAASQREHERSLAAVERETRFTLGVSSHMSNVVFDKHVTFCEEYAAVADKALDEIFRAGPTPDAVTLAGGLYAIRRKHVLWVTAEIDDKLQKFEQIFREMGSSAGYVQATRGEPEATQRKAHIERMYQHLSALTGISMGEGQDNDMAVTTTIQWLRAVLGTNELNAVRRAVFMRVMSELEKRTEEQG